MSDAAVATAATGGAVGDLEAVRGADFGPAVAERLRREGARLLALFRVPGWPGLDDEDLVVALLEDAAGCQAVAAPSSSKPSRPSASGAPSLVSEERLEREGLGWAEPAPPTGVLGRGVFTFPLGPVRGDVAESVGWRLEVMGDEVLGLRLRFGYKRRGLEERLGSAPPQEGVGLAERVTGTSPVAHATAYAMAWEAALGVEVPAPARRARAIAAELERVHSHLGDLASLVQSTGLPAGAAELFILKEEVLRLCWAATGHRYQRGFVGFGGLRRAPAWESGLPARLRTIAERLRSVVGDLDRSTSFLDRLHGAGRIPPEVAARMLPVGPVGRASGLPYDVRHDRPYGLYAEREAPRRAVAVRGDAWARYRVRVDEVLASLQWLQRCWDEGVPEVAPAALAPSSVEGGDRTGAVYLGRVEGPRGELVYVVRAGGRTPWVRLRSASAANWAVVPFAVAEGNVLQDVPIVDASFALSVAALDL